MGASHSEHGRVDLLGAATYIRPFFRPLVQDGFEVGCLCGLSGRCSIYERTLGSAEALFHTRGRRCPCHKPLQHWQHTVSRVVFPRGHRSLCFFYGLLPGCTVATSALLSYRSSHGTELPHLCKKMVMVYLERMGQPFDLGFPDIPTREASVANRARSTQRVPFIRKVPATVHFVGLHIEDSKCRQQVAVRKLSLEHRASQFQPTLHPLKAALDDSLPRCVQRCQLVTG